MFDCTDVTAAVGSHLGDPRITGEALRCIPSGNGAGAALLVGVVHDHPASTYRVARILETVTPDVLALELPPLALPLFRMYARDVYTPPRLGGEMSMALQAAGDVESVGIDGPNRTYLRMLVGNLADQDISGRAIPSVLKDIVTSSAQALTCRLGALVGTVTPLRLRVYSHIEYDCTLLDSPTTQEAHEREYLSQQRAFLKAVKIPQSIQVIDRTREESMAAQLQELRMHGDVTAIIGMEHLDTVEQLISRSSRPSNE